MTEITQILQNWRVATNEDRNEVFAILYDELRKIAKGQMLGEKRSAVIQPTVIANEAYLRLVKINQMDYTSRSHFFATAASLMRRILVDLARSRNAVKRDGGRRITLTSNFSKEEAKPLDVILLDEALDLLKAIDQDVASILEARYFGGLTVDEVANVLRLSRATVTRKSRIGIAWLRKEMEAA